ncbi:hypothetical protein FRB95_009881 [Tulasnella sp. JGI-2019a]|nr:hypothetical protein FRB95_009881 [Tulasnella sp. JGI-2019a]
MGSECWTREVMDIIGTECLRMIKRVTLAARTTIFTGMHSNCLTSSLSSLKGSSYYFRFPGKRLGIQHDDLRDKIQINQTPLSYIVGAGCIPKGPIQAPRNTRGVHWERHPKRSSQSLYGTIDATLCFASTDGGVGTP